MKPPRCSPLTLMSTPFPACCRSASRIALVGRPNIRIRSGFKRLRIGLLCPLSHNSHVRLHRLGVRVDLHYRYFVSGLVHEFVERDQPRLAGLDELDESRYAASFAF